MSQNPILDDLHAVREKLLSDAGGDLHRYVEEARQRALASGRPIATPVRRARPRTRAKSVLGTVEDRLAPAADH